MVYILILRLPFSWKTPGGYLFALIFESISAFYTCLFLSSLLCFMIGSSLLLMDFVGDITNNLSHLIDTQTLERGNHAKITVNFYDTVQFHSCAKQLSWHLPLDYLHILFHNLNFRFTKEFSEIYEFIITGAFLWCLVTICSSLLVLQAEIVKVSYMKSVSWNKIYFISLFFS